MKLSLLFSFALVACSGVDSSITQEADEPIVGGVADRGAHPAVVAIDVAGQGLCTGTLVAPDVVLTARHCVSYTAEHVSCAYDDVRGDREPSTLAVYAGDTVAGATFVGRGRELVVPAGRALCDRDVAALVLDRAAVGVRPAAIASDAPRPGAFLTVVGFGRSGPVGGAGVKRRRAVRVLDVASRELEVGEATCPGDSGGPAFDAAGDVVGIVSRGRARCSGPTATNIFTRADVVRALIARARRAR